VRIKAISVPTTFAAAAGPPAGTRAAHAADAGGAHEKFYTSKIAARQR